MSEYEKEVLNLLRQIANQTAPKPEKKEDESSKKDHDSLEEILACPDCYPKMKKAVIEREFKDTDYKCEGCGLPVKGEESKKEEWNCPSCGSKFAKPK